MRSTLRGPGVSVGRGEIDLAWLEPGGPADPLLGLRSHGVGRGWEVAIRGGKPAFPRILWITERTPSSPGVQATWSWHRPCSRRHAVDVRLHAARFRADESESRPWRRSRSRSRSAVQHATLQARPIKCQPDQITQTGGGRPSLASAWWPSRFRDLRDAGPRLTATLHKA